MCEKRESLQIKKAVMFLVYNEGKYLIEERIREDSSHKDMFIVPAGHVEIGESFEDAMKRELPEEQGIFPKKYIRLDSFKNMSLSGNLYEVEAYLVTEYQGEVINREPQKCKLHWLSFDEAMEKMDLASSKYMLLLAKSALNVAE